MKLKAPAILGTCALLTLLAMPSALAQTEPTAQPAAADSLKPLIERVAQKTGKKFLVDPRVRGEAVLIGLDPASLDYPALLSILQLNGFAAVEDGNYVRVMPIQNIRQAAVPVTTTRQSHLDAEFVSLVIPVKNVPAPQLVPILRPLLPQHAHLTAIICRNTLLVVDSFANARRIEKLVQTLDTGDAYAPPKCGSEPPIAPAPPPPPAPAPAKPAA